MASDKRVAPPPTLRQFAIPQGWKITSWTVGGPGPGIPSNGLMVHGTLLIGIAKDPSACDLAWLNSSGKLCSITNLPFASVSGHLQGDVPVKFGRKTVPCGVVLSIGSNGQLTGKLDLFNVDGNTGTFAADANPPAESYKRRHK